MRTIGGGFLVSALVIAFLQIKFYSMRLRWIPLLILITGILTYGSSLYSQIIIRTYTQGSPPTTISISALVSLLAGYTFNLTSLRKKQCLT
jgi:predicted RND superfamily exporter protein